MTASALFVERDRVGDCVAFVELRDLVETVELSRAVAFVDVRVRETVVRLVAVEAAVEVRVRALFVTELLRVRALFVTEVRFLVAASREFVETTIGPLAVITVLI